MDSYTIVQCPSVFIGGPVIREVSEPMTEADAIALAMVWQMGEGPARIFPWSTPERGYAATTTYRTNTTDVLVYRHNA